MFSIASSPVRALVVAFLLVVAGRTAEAAIVLRNTSTPDGTHIRKRFDLVLEIDTDTPVASAVVRIPGVQPGRAMWLLAACTSTSGTQLCERRRVELEVLAQAPPEGAYDAIVEVTNQAGERADLSIPFFFDRPPVVTMSSPPQGLVPRTRYVTVRGTCADTLEGTCPTVLVRRLYDFSRYDTLATFHDVSAFEVQVDLQPMNARAITLIATGLDGHPVGDYPYAGHEQSRGVFADNSPAYRRIGETPAGHVYDASSTRAVFEHDGEWFGSEHATGSIQPLEGYGVVTPGGFAWSVDGTLFVQSDGVVQQYEAGPSAPRVAGRFLAWDSFRSWEPATAAKVHLLDLDSGQHTVIDGAYGPWPSTTGTLYFLRPGAPTQLVYRDGSGERVVASGRRVVASDGVNAIALSSGCVPELLGPDGLIERLPEATCTAGRHYPAVVRNGWVAYSFPPGGVYRRAPGGVRTRIGNNLGVVEDVSPDGEVSYVIADVEVAIGSRGRWLVPVGGPSTKVGSSIGTASWRDERWILPLGNSTFQIMGPTTPDPLPPDAGVPDAGVPDAGVDAPADAPVDATAPDAIVDASTDAGGELSVDAGVDAAPEPGADASSADAAPEPGVPDGGAVEPAADAGEHEPDGEGCSAGGTPGAVIMLALAALARRRRARARVRRPSRRHHRGGGGGGDRRRREPRRDGPRPRAPR
jgi:hypothetical protein